MTRGDHVDAIVIGAGHNGLVAANLLADAGLSVLVLEASDRHGGAVGSDEATRPGFVTDQYSAFYPLGAASPVLRGLELDRWGLTWRHAPAVLAHVFPDDRCAVLHRDADDTAASLDTFAPGDGAAWLGLVESFRRIHEPFLDAILGPFPPVRAGVRLARRLGTAELLRFARFAVQPVRRFAEETFRGAGGPILFAGNALHTDLPPEASGSAIYGWLLCMLGQTVGFPVPAGGAGALADALVARAQAGGVTLRTSAPVDRVLTRDGRASGVRLASGEVVRAATVVADVGAPQLYLDLVGRERLPRRLVDDLDRFQWDAPTLKVNWALSQPIPWTAADARGAGTVHLGADFDGLTMYAASLAIQRMPENPFVLLGQMTTSDPVRSPAGTESVWAYTHVPDTLRGDADQLARQVERIEALLERHAPGFGSLVLDRSVQTPADLENADANLRGGAVGGGTASIHQALVFRPVPGLARPETPVDGLYLASASAHPGGGVHGAPGSNAALAALSRAGRTGRVRRAVVDAAYRRIYS